MFCILQKTLMTRYFLYHYPDKFICVICKKKWIHNGSIIPRRLPCPIYWRCSSCSLKRKIYQNWKQKCSRCNQPASWTLYDGVRISQPRQETLLFCEPICKCCWAEDNPSGKMTWCKQVSLVAMALQQKCALCPRRFNIAQPQLWEWDHLQPRCFTGRPMVSAYYSKSRSYMAAMLEEIRGCRLLCLNCHDIHSRKQLATVFAPRRFRDWEQCVRSYTCKRISVPPSTDPPWFSRQKAILQETSLIYETWMDLILFQSKLDGLSKLPFNTLTRERYNQLKQHVLEWKHMLRRLLQRFARHYPDEAELFWIQ